MDITCPQCDRLAHTVCGNPECRCVKALPDGEKPLERMPGKETERCSYCGFVADSRYWEQREIDVFLASQRAELAS